MRSLFSCSALLCATTIMSRPFSLALLNLKLSLINLFTLFLLTAAGIRFADTERPSLASSLLLVLTNTIKHLSAYRRADLKTALKSEGLESLYFSGNRPVLPDTTETKLQAAFSPWPVLP